MPTPTFGHLNSPRGAVQGMNWVWDAVLLDWVPETQPGSISAGADGALLDGVSTAIRATVKNYTNSKPLTVVTVDTNGDPVSSGGTVQYAEDTAATAGEQVVMVGVVRKDTRATLVDTDGDRAELQVNASGDLRVDGSAITQPVSATSLPLPAGAATSAKQDTLLTELQLKADLTETQPVSAASLPLPTGAATEATLLTRTKPADQQHVIVDSSAAVAITAAALPLPAGAATSANQVTELASLASIDTKLTSPVTVTGALTDTQLRASAVPVTANAGTNLNTSALNLEATQALVKAKTDNLDVLLSTRLKPADTLAAVTTVGTITNVVHVDDNAGSLTVDGTVAVSNAFNLEATQALVKAKTDNLDVLLSTRLKPADTLAAVTSITNVVHVDDNAGSLTVDGSVSVSNFPTTIIDQGAVTTDEPVYTPGQNAALSLTPAGRLRIDTEAGVRDFDGVNAIYVGDRVLRRQAEQAQLDAYISRMQMIIATEWESSQRMGFEVR